MTASPRWERESQEDLRPPATNPAPAPAPALAPEQTAEYDLAAAGLVDPEELSEPPEFADAAPAPEAPPEPRLAVARDSARESLAATRESLTVTAGKVGRWFAALDRRPELDVDGRHDPVAELTAGAPDAPLATGTPDPEPAPRIPAAPFGPEPGPMAGDTSAETEPEPARAPTAPRFPTAPLGYSRAAVDGHLAALEAELARLRAAVGPPLSITEEIERLGEQTASILVVAHDQAHETARAAQAQAARAVSDAAADADRMTREAERRLRELDEETDAVWRERARLIDDVRVVATSLASLAEDASERFPAAEPRESQPAGA